MYDNYDASSCITEHRKNGNFNSSMPVVDNHEIAIHKLHKISYKYLL